jgi:hypothetical protein
MRFLFTISAKTKRGKFMRILTRLLSIVIALVGILVVGNSLVSAQAQNTGSGIYISPVRTELVVSPGETKTVTVTVKNVTSATATYKVIVNDFIAGDNELGQPALILDDKQNMHQAIVSKRTYRSYP